jgi:hypothetical protein
VRFGHVSKRELDVIAPAAANHEITLAWLDLHHPLDGGARR